MSQMLSKPLMTIHEVADLLKVREATVRAWIHDNDLRAIKFGREWRVSQRDLEAYLNLHANRPPYEEGARSAGSEMIGADDLNVGHADHADLAGDDGKT